MAEHDENVPAEGAVPASRTPDEAPRTPGEAPRAADQAPRTPGEAPRAAAEGPPSPAETLGHGPEPRARAGRWSGRARGWAGNGGVRLGAVAIVAGLVGGLVGGGIVAAFSGDDEGHDRSGPVRFERDMRGGPGFGGPRYWGRPPYGRMDPRYVVPPPGWQGAPAQPTPVPSPKASG